MTKKFEKYYNDKGQIAVIYSPGFGAGWYSWNSDEGLLFDKEIVEAVLNENYDKAEEIAKQKYQAYAGGAHKLKIYWVTPGTQFSIEEYDGSESLCFDYDYTFITA